MKNQGVHTANWLVATFLVDKAGDIIRIDEKLARHIQELRAICVLIAPSGETLPEIPECGELSLSINNHKEHFFHLMVGHSQSLPNKPLSLINLNKEIRGNSRLSGFWADSGTVMDDERVFIPYKVKVHFEIVSK